MKKVLSLILALALAVGMTAALTSCDSKKIKVNPDKSKYVVGICQLVAHESLDLATEGFKDALADALEAEGREVEFKEQNGQGDTNTCKTIVNTFVSDDVDLILGNATAALQAAYNATETIPVLGTSITEYGVALGIENFDGVVGSNVSGTSDLAPLEDQAQMMIDVLDLKEGSVVGILYCSAEPNSQYQYDVVNAYLADKGIIVKEYKFSEATELQGVVVKASSECDAIYVPTDNTVASNDETVRNVCGPAKTPVFTGYESDVCFATLAISYYNIGAETGKMAAKVLLGEEDITEMAIAYDASPVKKYNKAICDELEIDTAALDKDGYVARESAEG
ncbi:MAG: ABC transporter substrate-binding protein [Oscillospiraceae bacterium]|nr:ABC transporter substrate-binding protein [Oscillospiraceae bacterium]